MKLMKSISYWYRVEGAGDPDDSGVIKLSRIGSSQAGGVYNGPGTTFVSNMRPQSAPLYGNPYVAYTAGDAVETNIGYVDIEWDDWFRLEHYSKLSSPGINNGKLVVRTDVGGLVSNLTLENRQIDDSFLYDSVLLGLMVANGEGEFQLYLDDMYIDDTRARIEIANCEDLYLCTHREIQVPRTTWNDSDILFEVNFGSFDSGEDLYLFVVNEEGVVSEGFLLEGSSALISPFDLSGDGFVNVMDLYDFALLFGSSDSSADFNEDGIVNILDALIIIEAFD